VCFDDLEIVYASVVERLSSHDTSNTAAKDENPVVMSAGEMVLH